MKLLRRITAYVLFFLAWATGTFTVLALLVSRHPAVAETRSATVATRTSTATGAGSAIDLLGRLVGAHAWIALLAIGIALALEVAKRRGLALPPESSKWVAGALAIVASFGIGLPAGVSTDQILLAAGALAPLVVGAYEYIVGPIANRMFPEKPKDTKPNP